jgi:hypothetical protein
VSYRIIFPDGIAPSPWPSDDAAWEWVLIVTGGLEDRSYEAVKAHWESQGVPRDDAHELMAHAQADVILTVQTLFAFGGSEDARRYALTGRAVEDALIATGRVS